jgi:hypothetical protein
MEILGAQWTDVLQVLIAFFGFLFVIYQVRRLVGSIAGDAHASLYGQYMDLLKMFLERPQLRPYFYKSNASPASWPDDARQQQEVEAACEMMLGLLEHAALQQQNLPNSSWEECWIAYTKERFAESPVLNDYWKKHIELYAMALRNIAPTVLKS